MKFSLVSVAAVLAIASSASAVMPRSAIVGTHRRQSASTNSRDVLNDALRSEGQDSKAVSLNLRGGDDEGAAGLMQTLKVGFYFGLWYALNIVYNSKSRPRFGSRFGFIYFILYMETIFIDHAHNIDIFLYPRLSMM